MAQLSELEVVGKMFFHLEIELRAVLYRRAENIKHGKKRDLRDMSGRLATLLVRDIAIA